MTKSGEAVRLGQVIRNIRKARNMTQEDLAVAIGYRPKSGAVTISRIERGELMPPTGRLIKIAEALGTPLGDIYADAQVDADEPSRLMGAALRIASGEYGERNAQLERSIFEDSRTLEEQLTVIWKDLSADHERVRTEFLLRLIAFTSQVKDIDVRSSSLGHDDVTGALETRMLEQQEEFKHQLVDVSTLPSNRAGTGPLGALAASAAYASVSTGTAISQLSGTWPARSNPAALGGEALSMGAAALLLGVAGIAGGAAVLGKAPPVVAVMMGSQAMAALGKHRKYVEREKERYDKLQAIQKDLDRFSADLETLRVWADRSGSIFEQVRALGMEPLIRINIALENQIHNWQQPPVSAEIIDPGQHVLNRLLDLAVVALSVSSLPLTAILDDPEPSTTGIDTQRERQTILEWNNRVLDSAEAHLAEWTGDSHSPFSAPL
jgi:transcriptional regulator with XRE-family HTH domain